MTTLDIFATAPAAPSTEKKAKGKKAKPELQIGTNLDVLAAADAIAKTLEGVQSAYSTMVKNTMSKHFASEGTTLGRRPENVRGIGDHSSASLELKKRDSRLALTTEEVTYLEEAGVEVEEKVTQEERFFFNEAILADPILRAKVSAAFALIEFGDITPIVKQEKVVSKIVSDESIEQAFKDKTPEQAEKLTAIVGTLAIKPTFAGTLREAIEVLETAGVTL